MSRSLFLFISSIPSFASIFRTFSILDLFVVRSLFFRYFSISARYFSDTRNPAAKSCPPNLSNLSDVSLRISNILSPSILRHEAFPYPFFIETSITGILYFIEILEHTTPITPECHFLLFMNIYFGLFSF